MIYTILASTYLIFAFLIFKNKGLKRLLYLLLGVFFVPGNINVIPISLLMGFMLYTAAFIFSMAYHGELKIKRFTECPLFKNLTAILIVCLIIGLLDEFQGPTKGMWEGLKYFLRTFFLFYAGWFSLNTSTDKIGYKEAKRNGNDSLFYTLLPFTIIVTSYGLLTAFTRTNPVLDAVGLEDRFFFEGAETYRAFRVTATNISSSVYGLACAVFFMCGFFLNKKKGKLQLIAIAMLFVNIFLTGTRAAIVPFLLCLFLYLIIYKGVNTTIKYSLIGLITTVCLTPMLPDSITELISEIYYSIVDVIFPTAEGNEKFGGSSVDARAMQMATAMEFLKERPFFGHGIGYANNFIMREGKHEGLLGMESYICWIGVEFGLVYAITILLFFINNILYFFKNRMYAPQYAYMGIFFVIMYIFYLIGAWVGNAWYYIMPILGYLTRIIYIRKKEAHIRTEQ